MVYNLDRSEDEECLPELERLGHQECLAPRQTPAAAEKVSAGRGDGLGRVSGQEVFLGHCLH